jgi:hypothetical protein
VSESKQHIQATMSAAIADWSDYELLSETGRPRLAMAPRGSSAPGANDDAIGAFTLALVGLIATPVFVFSIVALVYAHRALKRSSFLEGSGFYPSGRVLTGVGIAMSVVALAAGVVAWSTIVFAVL